MGSRHVILLLALILLFQPLAGTPVQAQPTNSGSPEKVEFHSSDFDSPAAAATSEEIVRTMTFDLTPSQPGEVAVEMTYSLPDSVGELTSTVPERATITDTDGFSSDGTGNFSWDGETAGPSIDFTMPANRTGTYQYDQRHGSAAEHGAPGYTFVDTGPWALVSVPPISVWWSYRGTTPPTLVRRTETVGDGIAGDRMVFLGSHTADTRTVDGHEMTLVVPSTATLEPSADAVFSSIEHASRSLPVGNGDGDLLFIAAPTGVDWGPYGLTDGNDAWVRADQSLSDPNNVWLHEYVHLRQDFRTTESARWTEEAMGEYYAAVLTLQQGRINFDTFNEHLGEGMEPRFDDTVLTRPDTWAQLGNYVKGGLVFGNLDREMRVSTDGSAPASRLFRAMNEREERVDHSFLRSEIDALAGTEVANSFDTYASTDRTPAMWNRSAHTAAYSTLPPRMVTDIGAEYEIRGPYRNRSVWPMPVLVPGENLTIPATVTNEGEADGPFQLELTVDGETVDTVSGTLSGASNRTVGVSHTFRETGNYTLGLEDRTWNVTVQAPAAVDVTEIAGTAGPVDPDEPLQVVVFFENSADRPGEGDRTVFVDGEPTRSWQLRLDATSTTERSIELRFQEPGQHEVKVGGEQFLVQVEEPLTSSTEEPTTMTTEGQTQETTASTTTETTIPGFGFGLAIAGILFAIIYRR